MLSSITALMLACEPGGNFEIVNDSDSPVILEIRYGNNEIETRELSPGESWGIFVPEGGYSPAFRVLDPQGQELERIFLTWEQMLEIDFRYSLR